MSRRQSKLGIIFFAIILFTVFVLHIVIFGGRTAESILCMVPHSDSYKTGASIPANICTDAATKLYNKSPDGLVLGGGKKTQIVCTPPGAAAPGTCTGSASATVDVIWQWSGVFPSSALSSFQVYVKSDPTNVTLADTSCTFPTDSKTYNPFWGAPLDGAFCNVASKTAGWKMSGADPTQSPPLSDVPQPGSVGKGYVLMTLAFTGMTATTTVKYDYQGGSSGSSVSKILEDGQVKNIIGCSTDTYTAADCNCAQATEATDNCYELDINRGIPAVSILCAPTAPTISWGAPAGCPGAGTVVPTINFTGSTCQPESGTCGNAGTAITCGTVTYSVRTGSSAGAEVGTGNASGIALPAVAVSTPVTYAVVAVSNSLGYTPVATNFVTVGPSTSPSCDQAPTVTPSTVKINNIAYNDSSGKLVVGQNLTVTGTIADSDASDSNLTLAKVFVYYGTNTSMNAAPLQVTPTSSGNFTATIPGSFTSGFTAASRIRIAIVTQDKDGTGNCFDAAGALQAAGICATWPNAPSNFNPSDANTAQLVSIPFIQATAFEFGISSKDASGNDIREPFPSSFPLRPAPHQSLRFYFKLSDTAAVTMRIYSLDGTLVRVIGNTVQPLTCPACLPDQTCPVCAVDNGCKWDEGCVWDGTNYQGLDHFVANGMYVVNIHATCTGTLFPGATIDFTRGIVIMK